MIHSARFLVSSSDVDQCPKYSFAEYAFIGRSNVGKSSLINALTNNKKLAKTSGTPGKTKLINHFGINESWFLVDLPGYGYAKLSKQGTFNIFCPFNASIIFILFVEFNHLPSTKLFNVALVS